MTISVSIPTVSITIPWFAFGFWFSISRSLSKVVISIWVSVSMVSVGVTVVTRVVPWLSFGISFRLGISRPFSSVVSVAVSVRTAIISTVSTISVSIPGVRVGLRLCRYNGNNESYEKNQKLHGCQLNCELQCRLSH